MTTFLRRLGPERTWPASNMASCNQVLLQSHLFAAVSPFFARLALEGDQTWHRTTSRVQCTHIWRGGQNYANTSRENKTNANKTIHKYTTATGATAATKSSKFQVDRQSTFALISRSHAFAHGSEFSQRPIRWTKLESDVWRKWSIRSSSLHYVTLFCSAVHYVRSGEWCVTHVGHYKQQEVGKWPNWKAQCGWLTWTWSPGLIIDLSFAKIQRELKRDCKKTIRALVYKLLTLLIMLTLL